MNCENIKEKLSLYIDNLLDKDEAEKINEHIENCNSCGEYYKQLLKLGAMVDGFDISDNDKYWESQKDKVIEKIEQAESEKIIKVQSVKKRGGYYKYLAVAASIALVAFVSIYESQEFNQFKCMFDDSTIKVSAPEVSTAPITVKEKTVQDGQMESIDARGDLNLNGVGNEPVIKTTSHQKRPAVKSQAVPKSMRGEATLNGIESDYQVKKPSSKWPPLKIGKPDASAAKYELDDVLQSINVSPGANKIKLLSIDIPRAVVKEEIVQPAQKISGNDEEKQKLRSLDESNIYPKVGLIEAEVYIPKPTADKDSAFSEINLYKIRLDSLEEKYEGIYSPHFIESSAKSRKGVRPDSLNIVILEMAESCFQVGILTVDDKVREEMIDKLQRLTVNGNPESIEKIQRYIVLLLTAE